MIADHVAAYAAGLHDGRAALTTGLSWTQISAAIAAAGMGSYSEDELMDGAAAYRRSHVAPGALAFLNSISRKVPR